MRGIFPPNNWYGDITIFRGVYKDGLEGLIPAICIWFIAFKKKKTGILIKLKNIKKYKIKMEYSKLYKDLI